MTRDGHQPPGRPRKRTAAKRTATRKPNPQTGITEKPEGEPPTLLEWAEDVDLVADQDEPVPDEAHWAAVDYGNGPPRVADGRPIAQIVADMEKKAVLLAEAFTHPDPIFWLMCQEQGRAYDERFNTIEWLHVEPVFYTAKHWPPESLWVSDQGAVYEWVEVVTGDPMSGMLSRVTVPPELIGSVTEAIHREQVRGVRAGDITYAVTSHACTECGGVGSHKMDCSHRGVSLGPIEHLDEQFYGPPL